jgi:hypothetical protein
VDPDLRERPGDYLGAKGADVIGALPARNTEPGRGIRDQDLSPPPSEWWAVVHVCEAYWHRPDPWTSMDDTSSARESSESKEIIRRIKDELRGQQQSSMKSMPSSCLTTHRKLGPHGACTIIWS